MATSGELCCCVSETSSWLCFLCVCVCQSNYNVRRKQVDTSCVKQSDKPTYGANVLGGAVSKKNRHQHYYDTPKYVAYVLGRPVSKAYRRLPESQNY